MKPKFQAYAISKEAHHSLVEGLLQKNGSHLHLFLRDGESRGIKEVQELLRAWLNELRGDAPSMYLGLDVQPCKNVNRWLSYITKEDVMPLCSGVDFDKFSPLCKIHAYASSVAYATTHPIVFSMRNQCNYIERAWVDIRSEHRANGYCGLCSDLKDTALGLPYAVSLTTKQLIPCAASVTGYLPQ